MKMYDVHVKMYDLGYECLKIQTELYFILFSLKIVKASPDILTPLTYSVVMGEVLS